jgi:hypothetical protein
MYEDVQLEIDRGGAAEQWQGGFQMRDGSNLQEKDSEINFGVQRGQKLSYTNWALHARRDKGDDGAGPALVN